MVSGVTRIVVPPTRLEIGSVKLAMDIVTDRCKELKYSGEIVLLVPSEDRLKGSAFDLVFGTFKVVDTLLENRSVPLQGYRFRLGRLVTISTLNPEIVLVIFADDTAMQHVDDLRSVHLVVVAPESMEQISNWLTKWKPIVEESPYPDERPAKK